jgi:hypothetical protein
VRCLAARTWLTEQPCGPRGGRALPRRGFPSVAACSSRLGGRGAGRGSLPRGSQQQLGAALDGRWARPAGIPGQTSSCRRRPAQLEEAAAAAATMSAGDAVCTGWLVKSPPERKLQRYVSRGAAASRASCPRVPARGVGSPWPRQTEPLPAPGLQARPMDEKRNRTSSQCRRYAWQRAGTLWSSPARLSGGTPPLTVAQGGGLGPKAQAPVWVLRQLGGHLERVSLSWTEFCCPARGQGKGKGSEREEETRLGQEAGKLLGSPWTVGNAVL